MVFVLLAAAAPAAAFRLSRPMGHARALPATTPTQRPARTLPTTMSAGAEPTEPTEGGGVRTLEVWEKYNFATNKAFWRDLRRSVYDGEVKAADLERFEGFCDNYRSNPEVGQTDPLTGQCVCPIGNFPGLTAKPIHDTSELKWVPEFERRMDVIAAEYHRFMSQASGEMPSSYKSRDATMDPSKSWMARNAQSEHWAGNDFHSLHLVKGLSYKPLAKTFPGTMRLLESLDLVGDRSVAFNRQKAHTGLATHSDKMNYVLAGHVGIALPAECGIEVSGERFQWETDRVTVIDNSFPHHTWNDSEEDRIIFYFDFFHPELSQEERRALMIFKRTFKTYMKLADKERETNLASLERLMGLNVGTDN